MFCYVCLCLIVDLAGVNNAWFLVQKFFLSAEYFMRTTQSHMLSWGWHRSHAFMRTTQSHVLSWERHKVTCFHENGTRLHAFMRPTQGHMLSWEQHTVTCFHENDTRLHAFVITTQGHMFSYCTRKVYANMIFPENFKLVSWKKWFCNFVFVQSSIFIACVLSVGIKREL